MLAGYAGQFSFGHMGFMGIGAYTAALFSHYFYLSPGADRVLHRVSHRRPYLVIVDPSASPPRP